MGLKVHRDLPWLERRIRYFLYDLSVDWGFYLSESDTSRIACSKHILAYNLALEVVKAEGFGDISDGTDGRYWVKKIAQRFADKLGADELFTD